MAVVEAVQEVESDWAMVGCMVGTAGAAVLKAGGVTSQLEARAAEAAAQREGEMVVAAAATAVGLGVALGTAMVAMVTDYQAASTVVALVVVKAAAAREAARVAEAKALRIGSPRSLDR